LAKKATREVRLRQRRRNKKGGGNQQGEGERDFGENHGEGEREKKKLIRRVAALAEKPGWWGGGRRPVKKVQESYWDGATGKELAQRGEGHPSGGKKRKKTS